MADLEILRRELLEHGDEMISFQQLVERFDSVEEEYPDQPWNLVQIYNNFNMLIGEKSNKWIACSEKLPETYDTVCATIKWNLCDLSSIAFGYYTKDEGWQLIDTEGNRCYDFTVIAWMLLQPYKEGNDKE